MIYALVALGYTMVYGVLELINFAHGEIFTMGGYLGTTFLIWVGLNDGFPLSLKILYVILAFIVSIILTSFLGWLIDFLAYRPLRKMTRIAPLLSAIGVSIFLQNFMLLVWGTAPVKIPESAVLTGSFVLYGINVRYLALLIIGFSLIIMGLLTYFVANTNLGKAMRATSQDMEAAEMMGINTNRTIAATFVIGSALAAIAGILITMFFGTLKFDTGFLFGIKAFTAAVLGGIGNIPGAVVGALILGLVENYGIGLTFGSISYMLILVFLIGVFLQYYVLPRRPLAIEGKVTRGAEKKSFKEIDNRILKTYWGGWLASIYYLFIVREESQIRLHAIRAIRISSANTILFLMIILTFFFWPEYQISSQWKEVIAFIVLMVVLIFRPSGVLGERLPEKV